MAIHVRARTGSLQLSAATCSNAGLSTSHATRPDASGLQDPSNSSSSIYNGVEPTPTNKHRTPGDPGRGEALTREPANSRDILQNGVLLDCLVQA